MVGVEGESSKTIIRSIENGDILVMKEANKEWSNILFTFDQSLRQKSIESFVMD